MRQLFVMYEGYTVSVADNGSISLRETRLMHNRAITLRFIERHLLAYRYMPNSIEREYLSMTTL